MPLDDGARRQLKTITASLNKDKAEDIVVIDLAGKSSIADFMVIASGSSSRHVNSLSEKLIRILKSEGVRDLHAEGTERGDWVLVDAGDVIVQLFRPEVRAFYNLEKMWGLALPESSQAFVDRDCDA